MELIRTGSPLTATRVRDRVRDVRLTEHEVNNDDIKSKL